VYPSNHRSVYLMTQRLQRHPYLGLFDEPETNTSTEQRTSSTVPQQALFLMNNPFVLRQAEGLARKLIHMTSDSRQRIALAYQLVWWSPARQIVLERGIWYIDEYKQQLAEDGVPKD